MHTPDAADLRVKIVTIKWGQRYPASYVNLLYDASRRFGLENSEFICFTENADGLAPGIEARPLPEIVLPEAYRWTFWRKLSLFDPVLGLAGACLYLDLDVVITGDLQPLMLGWRGQPRFIRNWLGKKTIRRGGYEHINSSVMLFEGGSGGRVLERFHADQQAAFSRYRRIRALSMKAWPKALSSSKRGCVLASKSTASPDPHEVVAGYQTGRLKHRCQPVPWIPKIVEHPIK